MQLKAIHRRFLQELGPIYNPHEAAVITGMVLEEIAGVTKSILVTHPQQELSGQIVNSLEQALERLGQHEPVQYVLEKAWFYKLPFYVSPAVLIPRPETEELVQASLSFIGSGDKFTVLDIGTGSGCIAISIKSNAPGTTVTAIDVSEGALQVATRNAQLHNVSIVLQQLNFLDEMLWRRLETYDVIVSNPPYIPFDEKDKLDKNVTQFEPATALFVPNNEHLIFYQKIASFASQQLAPAGKIFMEVHESYASQVADHFISKKFTTHIKEDFYGKERIVIATHSR